MTTQDAGYQPDEACGDYRLLRLLGSGGYADVFKARHAGTGDVVALKRLKPQHATNARAKERFLAEARLFARIQHANVVRVTRVGSDQGLIWMAMEFLEGGTLRDVLKTAEGPLPAVQALYFAREVADGVAALHEERVVHRDLKPENVMVTEAGAVKVLDAGAAKFFGWDVQSTGPLGAVGTPLYMAPEHILGEPVDVRTDIYALGLMLYEMLAGRHAFARDPGRQATQLDIIAWQLHAVPPPLREVSARVSEGVSTLVERAIAKKPHDRFGSMPEFAKALRVEWKRAVEEGVSAPEIRLPVRARPEDEITTEPRGMAAGGDVPARREPRDEGALASVMPETVTIPVRSSALPEERGLGMTAGESATVPLPVRPPPNGTEPLLVDASVLEALRQGPVNASRGASLGVSVRDEERASAKERPGRLETRANRGMGQPARDSTPMAAMSAKAPADEGEPPRGGWVLQPGVVVLFAAVVSMVLAVLLVMVLRGQPVPSAEAESSEPSTPIPATAASQDTAAAKAAAEDMAGVKAASDGEGEPSGGAPAAEVKPAEVKSAEVKPKSPVAGADGVVGAKKAEKAAGAAAGRKPVVGRPGAKPSGTTKASRPEAEPAFLIE